MLDHYLGISPRSQVSATHIKISHVYIASMGAQSSYELKKCEINNKALGLNTEYQDNSRGNGRQDDMR